jgi:probable rRNA maturation factor
VSGLDEQPKGDDGHLMSVDVHDESGADVDVDRLAVLSRFVLDRLRVHPLAELSVVAVDPDTMAAHHLQWMDEAGPTDVMAFPMDELRPGDDEDEPEPGLLGDVVLCPQVAEEQARVAGHTTGHELDLLCAHGILHLLGFDHAEDEEKAEMFGLQAELLRAWWAARGLAAGVTP